MYPQSFRLFGLLAMAGLAILAGIIGWSILTSERQQLKFSTGSTSGLYFEIASHVGEVAEASIDGLDIEILTSSGSLDNVQKLVSAEADLAIVQNDTRGSSVVRSLAVLYPEALHFVCRKDKSIRGLEDVSTLRVNLGAQGSGTLQVAKKLLEFARVNLDPESVHTVSFDVALQMLNDEELDAAFFLLGVGASAMAGLLENSDLELVPIVSVSQSESKLGIGPKQFVDGFRVGYPYVSYAEIPMMAYSGKPPSPIASLAVQSVLVCRSDMEDSLASGITAAVFENRADLARQNIILSGLTESASESNLQFPIHSGAEDFYRRKEPGFLSQNAESLGLLITVALLAGSALHRLQRGLIQRKKDRADTYYARVQRILDGLERDPSEEQIASYTEDLQKIETEACHQLIDENLTADESYLILQNMCAICRASLIGDRKA